MEPTVEQRIKTVDIAARILICVAVVLIGGGLAIRIMTAEPYANVLAGTGLVFVALFGVAAYTKKKLIESTSAGIPFHKVQP
jgi:hypothetical protein